MSLTLFNKMFRDHWKSLLAWGLVVVFMIAVVMSIYPSIVKSGNAAKEFIDAYPEAMKKIFRMQDYTSGPGFLGTELFSLMLPLVMIGVGVLWGSSATAEEEERGTADLLFALPISRYKILFSKMVATFVALFILALLAFLTVFIVKDFVDLTVGTQNLAYACISQLFLGVFFAGVGFLLGSLTGRKGVTLGVGSALGFIAFLFFSISPLVSNFEFTNPFNPFQWTIGTNILADGLNSGGLIKLLVASLLLHIFALILIERRQIHS